MVSAGLLPLSVGNGWVSEVPSHLKFNSRRQRKGKKEFKCLPSLSKMVEDPHEKDIDKCLLLAWFRAKMALFKVLSASGHRSVSIGLRWLLCA